MSDVTPSDWQSQVLNDLDSAVQAYPDDVARIGDASFNDDGSMLLRIRVRTDDIATVDGGLQLGDHEEFTVTVHQTQQVPPSVEVDHLRFLHHAHVLQGTRPCLYLDASREWDPLNGFGAFLDRLLEWLTDAAAGRFDAQTALYHAVGGVLHADDKYPTIVVRSEISNAKRAQHAWLIQRTEHRFDLTQDPAGTAIGAEHVPVVLLRSDLPLGAGSSLAGFLYTMADPYAGHPHPGRGVLGTHLDVDASAMVLTAVAASAIRKPDGSPQHFLLAVPHPTGGPAHLLAGRIPVAGADQIRALVRRGRKASSFIDPSPGEVDVSHGLDWVPVSDERDEVTTRRDSARPVTAYAGKTVHVWGCGGLGSWVAEYLVRAGVKKLVVCDPGSVAGGLLVRQNFVENDVGKNKAHALAERLDAISDGVEVVACEGFLPDITDFGGAHLIIDATVSVAIGRLLDGIAKNSAGSDRPIFAHMATDPKTSTLGILTVSMAPQPKGPISIDRAIGTQIIDQGVHEPFHGLWSDSNAGEELIPTRGCSTPTFHGAAADMAGVAASLVSILSAYLTATESVSGSHLISMPHGEAGPLRTFFPAPEIDEATPEPETAEPEHNAEGVA